MTVMNSMRCHFEDMVNGRSQYVCDLTDQNLIQKVYCGIVTK